MYQFVYNQFSYDKPGNHEYNVGNKEEIRQRKTQNKRHGKGLNETTFSANLKL